MTSILKVDTIQDTAGNNIINESGDTITIGASGDTVNVLGTLQNNGSGVIQGITMVDRWRLSTNITGTNQPITSNLERSDETDAGFIGTGMTESSGIFTFPSTGIYLIQAQFAFQLAGSARYISPALLVTSNNSSYTLVSSTDVFIAQVASLTTYTMAFFSHTFDVTNVTTHKVKFDVESSANVSTVTRGTTTSDLTAFTFIRLGDT
jgi:hypothetical protein